jgi:basic membrane protein A
MRKYFWAILGCIALVATACGDDDAADPPAAELSVGFVVPSSINDQAFSQVGHIGFVAGIEQTGASEAGIVQNVAPGDAAEAMANLANEGATLVIALGGQFGQAGIEVAPRFPDTHFVVINGFATGPNLSSWSLSEGEVAYLGGILVASTLDDVHVLAKISGLEIPPLQLSAAGFNAGARSIIELDEFIATFTGDQNDAALAFEATVAAFGAGADVVMTGLNNALSGMEQAAAETGGLLVSDIIDKCDDPDVGDSYYAATSADVIFAVTAVITGVADGSLEPGFVRQNLEEPDGFVVRLCDGEIPEDVQTLIDEARAGLVDGSITIDITALN